GFIWLLSTLPSPATDSDPFRLSRTRVAFRGSFRYPPAGDRASANSLAFRFCHGYLPSAFLMSLTIGPCWRTHSLSRSSETPNFSAQRFRSQSSFTVIRSLSGSPRLFKLSDILARSCRTSSPERRPCKGNFTLSYAWPNATYYGAARS